MNAPEAGSAPTPPFSWRRFLITVFTPTVLIAVLLLIGFETPTALIAIIGGALSGAIGGVQLARYLGKTLATQTLLAVAFLFVLGASCIAVNCFSCIAIGQRIGIIF